MGGVKGRFERIRTTFRHVQTELPVRWRCDCDSQSAAERGREAKRNPPLCVGAALCPPLDFAPVLAASVESDVWSGRTVADPSRRGVPLTRSLRLRGVPFAPEQLRSSLLLAPALSRGRRLVRTQVLVAPAARRLTPGLVVVLLQRPLPLAVELPGAEGSYGVLEGSNHSFTAR